MFNNCRIIINKKKISNHLESHFTPQLQLALMLGHVNLPVVDVHEKPVMLKVFLELQNNLGVGNWFLHLGFNIGLDLKDLSKLFVVAFFIPMPESLPLSVAPRVPAKDKLFSVISK